MSKPPTSYNIVSRNPLDKKKLGIFQHVSTSKPPHKPTKSLKKTLKKTLKHQEKHDDFRLSLEISRCSSHFIPHPPFPSHLPRASDSESSTMTRSLSRRSDICRLERSSSTVTRPGADSISVTRARWPLYSTAWRRSGARL